MLNTWPQLYVAIAAKALIWNKWRKFLVRKANRGQESRWQVNCPDMYQWFFFCLFFFRYTFLFLQNKGPNPQLTKKIAGLNCGPERLNTVTPLGLVSWHSRHHKTCLCHCFLHCVLKKYLTKNKWLCVRSSLSFHDVLGHTLAEICAYLSYQCLLMP